MQEPKPGIDARPERSEKRPARGDITELAPGVLRSELPVQLPGLGHVVGLQRNLLENIRLDVRVQRGIDLGKTEAAPTATAAAAAAAATTQTQRVRNVESAVRGTFAIVKAKLFGIARKRYDTSRRWVAVVSEISQTKVC